MKIVFPDLTGIASMSGVDLMQGEAVKRGRPVLVAESPCEGLLTYLYGSVLKRNSLYRMWYQAQGIYVAYARSRDGIVWEKPAFKRAVHPIDAISTVTIDGRPVNSPAAAAAKFRNTNIVSDLHMPSVIYHPEDRKRPYKLFGYTDGGYCAAFSGDGIDFRPAESNPVIPLIKLRDPKTKKTWFSDVAPVFRDTRRNRFVAHVKTYRLDSEGRVRRCVGYSESEDFIRWSDPATVWAPSERDDALARRKGFQWADFYGLCGFNYGRIYLGFLWLFFIDYEIERGTHEGKIEVYLARSLDGKTWERFSDSPLIALSPSGWDSGMITTANAPVFDRDGISIYYGGSNFSHKGGEEGSPYEETDDRFSIGLARLRKDGFVCAWSTDGLLTTVPLESEKGSIRVNADARDGRVSIDVIQRNRKSKTFTMEGADLPARLFRSALRGSVTLNISIRNAKLYSIEAL